MSQVSTMCIYNFVRRIPVLSYLFLNSNLSILSLSEGQQRENYIPREYSDNLQSSIPYYHDFILWLSI